MFSFKDFKSDDKDNIFSLFKKVHSLKWHKGQGIGLATARKVVEIHGGTGSTFYFTLAKVLINRFH